MTSITIPNSPILEERPSSLTMPAYPTASTRPSMHRRVPLFVPRDQAYYWTAQWQRDEAEAVREIGEGQGRRFTSGAAAAEWLLSDEDE